MEKWEPFWFEGNQAWGYIESAEDWKQIKKQYHDFNLGEVKQHKDGGKRYGLYCEYQGKDTLGEFFNRNNMNI